jgi:putative transposase
MLKVVKVRLYPTEQQKIQLSQAFGCTRWLWNRFLALTNETYKNTGKGLSRYDLPKQLPSLKKDFQWLAETYSQCLQAVCLNLSRAFINFFEKRSQINMNAISRENNRHYLVNKKVVITQINHGSK